MANTIFNFYFNVRTRICEVERTTIFMAGVNGIIRSTFAEALQKIANWVEKTQAVLKQREEVALSQVGKFRTVTNRVSPQTSTAGSVLSDNSSATHPKRYRAFADRCRISLSPTADIPTITAINHTL